MNIDKSPEKIRKMFDKISKNYDRLNLLISLGFDKFIKKECLKFLKITPTDKVLDLCTGTGDFASRIENSIGVDFSEKMLEIAKKRGVKTVKADCCNLPFEDKSFDKIIMAYGLRNIENRKRALEESYRVLKAGGKFLHLDFGEKNVIGKVFEFVVPIFAKVFEGDNEAYRYLLKSRREFPEPDELIKEFETVGFRLYGRRNFLFKTISCQVFVK